MFFDDVPGISESGSLAGFHRHVVLDKVSEPAERYAPAFVMSDGLIGVTGESGVLNPEQSAGSHAIGAAAMEAVHVTRLQFPAHDGFKVSDEVGGSGVYEQTGRVDFEILAPESKGSAVAAHAIVGPFAADAKIGVSVGNAESNASCSCGLDSPPLGALFGIGDGFEDAGRGGGDEDFREYGVLVGGDGGGGHGCLLFRQRIDIS